jgi:hydroxyacylglutathione hydrolase
VFNLDVGRPDLLGEETKVPMAKQLYDSLFNILIPLGIGWRFTPATGRGRPAGSPLAIAPRAPLATSVCFKPGLPGALKDRVC